MSSFRVTTGRDGSRSFYGEHDDRDRVPSGGGGRDRGGRDGGGRDGGGRDGGGRDGGGRDGGGRHGRRNNGRGALYKPGRGLNPRSRLGGDDDVDMSDQDGPSRQRYNPYSKRQQPYGRKPGGGYRKLAMDDEPRGRLPPGGPGGRGRGNRRNQRAHFLPFEVPKSPTGFYKILIPYANKVEKKRLFEQLNNAVSVPFIPTGFRMDGNNAIFYVREHECAKALKAVNKKISFPNGFKMTIIVRPETTPPALEVDDATIEKLKVCMSNRYDPTSKSLSLSDLYNDETLKADNIRLALNRRNAMKAVMDIINEHIPELLSLDLSNNRLMNLDPMADIATKAPNLVKLNLKGNNLKNINVLNRISSLKLDELSLEGNTLCDQFKDETSYVSAVRQRFPKVMVLDGHNLPAPVTFDTEENTVLPPSKGSYFISEDVQKRVCAFLEQYIKIYDSNNRQSLLEAYSENAVFSMMVIFNKLSPGKPNVGAYLSSSRNLLRVAPDNTGAVPGKREKLLRQGRLNVVSTLTELPASEHDLASFVVDVGLATPDLMTFTLRGVFRETSAKTDSPPLRYFSRTFVTVPNGPGLVILNEQFSITPASQKQVSEAFRTPAPTPSSSPVISAGTSAASPGGPAPGGPASAGPGATLTPELKMEMVQQFCLQSRMNQAFSQRCLEENNWDYEAAAQVFVGLQAKGSIPPEAFVQ